MFRRRVLSILLLLLLLAAATVSQSAARSFAPDLVDALGQFDPSQDWSEPGPYASGWEAVVVPDGLQGVDARLYYPATLPGQDAPFDPAGGPYPIIAFGHGFLQEIVRYLGTFEHLASHGFFVIAPNSETGFFPNHQALADDLNSSLDYVVQRNSDAASPYFGHVAVDRLGLSGHSMGGGASILAAAGNAEIDALINMAAAETNPSAIAVMPQIEAPVALLAGDEDTIVPVAQHGQLMYDNGAAPRLLPLIDGGYHCGFQTDPLPLFCDSGSIGLQAQLEITHRWLAAFFTLYLKSDRAPWHDVWGHRMLRDGDVQTQYDPGLSLSALLQDGSGAPGTTVSYPLTVTNVSDAPLTLSGARQTLNGWPVAFSTTGGTLSPGATAALTIDVTIPASATPGDNDILLLKIIDSGDGITGAFTAVRTTVP